MRKFFCSNCSNLLHFENDRCLNCGHWVGYDPGGVEMVALEQSGDSWRAVGTGRTFRFCDNYSLGACNWLIGTGESSAYCEACQHNRTIPHLASGDVLALYQKMEAAKHRLFYSLLRWQLPLQTRAEDPVNGLAFDFLQDNVAPDQEPVMTGHASGLITINLAEADDAERERRRTEMGEPYRTVLGHFRHEIAHYYWDVLVASGEQRLQGCRMLFGDEREDYGAALSSHYQAGPPPDWEERYVSAYATAHPWEDFAETFAHYLHMVDVLETSRAYSLSVAVPAGDGSVAAVSASYDPYRFGSLPELVESWVPLTVAVNGLNRSMGLPDLYPFVISAAVAEKLSFIHDMVRDAAKE